MNATSRGRRKRANGERSVALSSSPLLPAVVVVLAVVAAASSSSPLFLLPLAAAAAGDNGGSTDGDNNDKNEYDFVEYAEAREEAKRRKERDQFMFAKHEEWLETTWGGWSVRQLRAAAKRLLPFLEAVSDAMNSDYSDAATKDNSSAIVLHWLLVISLRSLAIGGFLLAAFAIAQLVNVFFARDITVVEEEVVVEEEEEEEEEERRRQGQQRRRPARDKKEK